MTRKQEILRLKKLKHQAYELQLAEISEKYYSDMEKLNAELKELEKEGTPSNQTPNYRPVIRA